MTAEFRLLGPLAAVAGGEHLPLGGGKQRAVLALLLLHADRLVTIERLVDELWGEQPPPSAAHTIEGYVSRLRRLLDPHGATIARRGDGYVLELAGARLDAWEAERLASAAAGALAERRYDEAARLTREALPLWRGSVLADVPLLSSGRAEADRLDELRLTLLEIWAEALLGLGQPEQVASELPPLLVSHPYRERFVAQLMTALYRCGRQAEALEAYERLRRTLDDELGLQPSPELQRLAGRIVRQDEELPTPTAGAAPPSLRARRRRVPLMAGAVVLMAGAAASLAFIAGAGRAPEAAASQRIALVLPRDPDSRPTDAFLTSITDGFHAAERQYGVEGEILVADEFDARAPSSRRMLARLRTGSFGLALVFGGGLGDVVQPVAKALPATRFAFFDADPDLPRATKFFFTDRQAGYLAGYLSGLVERSRGPRLNDAHVVSVIGGLHDVPSVEALLDGFTSGARQALPAVEVLRSYSDDFDRPPRCEAIANRQIDAGADIVFAAAGRCSLGALAATAIRGVWGVGVDADQSYLGEHILVSTVKRFDQAVIHAVRSYVQGTLRPGLVRLGVRDDGVGIAGIGTGVSDPIRRQVARVALDMRRRDGE